MKQRPGQRSKHLSQAGVWPIESPPKCVAGKQKEKHEKNISFWQQVSRARGRRVEDLIDRCGATAKKPPVQPGL